MDKIKAEAEAKRIVTLAESEARSKAADAMVKEAQAKIIEQGQHVSLSDTRGLDQSAHFDASIHVLLVLQFQDKDIDSYFVTFEHTANTLGWPKDKWSILLSSALKGRAQIAYAAMDPQDRCSYDNETNHTDCF